MCVDDACGPGTCQRGARHDSPSFSQCPESYCPAHHHHQHDLPQHPASLTSGAPHAGFRCPGPSQLVRAPLDLPQPEAAALP